ncbi:MAG TPA: dynamin family protein [Nostocaceae cyanobacterium]|nr:dynamin family protein [Nostocaceae cyanobacterium]
MQTQNQKYQGLIDSLKSACGLLNLGQTSQLYLDIVTLSNNLANPNFQIAVFGPFNHGKSTLLNALLGTRTLPIDLIPTTGAAITVKYGSDVRTRIMLVDGTEIYRSGTEILQQFAILDGNRQMRKDVASVEVFCPHPFLERGVEFVDLPGTNDREAQDQLVRDRLLGADLVIQLLDARKLMTLGERENLRDWLLDRGIKTVIFVANFLNLLEPEEQKQVQNRLLFVAESFRADLPAGFSNLYRVDALPALRARLKGDNAAAHSSGLVAFASALQNITTTLQQNRGSVRLPRVEAIASRLQPMLVNQIYQISTELKTFDDKENAKIAVKQKAKNLIQLGFNTSVLELREWLALPKLLEKYQGEIAIALAENKFYEWQTNTLKKDLTELQLSVMKWLYQAYEMFKKERPEDLNISFPAPPQLNLPTQTNNKPYLDESGSVAIGGGIGWLLGGPVGAAVAGSVSYLLNKNLQKKGEKTAKETYHQQVARICINAAENYLSQFSNQGLLKLSELEKQAAKIIDFAVNQEPQEITKKRQEIQQLQNGFNQLLAELQKVNISTKYQPYQEQPKSTNPQTNTTPKVETPHQQQTYTPPQPPQTKVETPRQQQTYTPPPPQTKVETPRQQPTTPPQTKVETPRQQPTTPPKSKEDLEVKFRAWELDQEIAEIKANMKAAGFQMGKQQNTNQTQPPPNKTKTEKEKEKVIIAYKILGLQPNAPFTEVKQAYKASVKKWHPDLFTHQPEMQQKAQEYMRLFNDAYTILENHFS